VVAGSRPGSGFGRRSPLPGYNTTRIGLSSPFLYDAKSTTAPEPRQLTEKGHATRAPILEHAATLIYAEGVHATNKDKLRRTAGVSGSQIIHHFPTKESLVLAVIE
jgi:Bacterial regulatory proteins, tetR family